MTDLLAVAAPLLARQHALITIAQAQELGASRQLVANYVRRGIWERVARGLYGPCGVPMTWRRRLMGAVLVAPPGSLASHRSCAALHRVGGLSDPPLELSVPRGHRHRPADVIVHESTDLELARRCTVDFIPTTGRARLAMDLGAVVSRKCFNQTIRELRYEHDLSTSLLLHTYLQHKRRGRNGGGALRDWLDRYFHVEGVPESGLEHVVLDAILDAGLPVPVAQHWVETASGSFRLDLAYPERRIAVEVDGRQHAEGDAPADDAARTAALERLGWTVIRIRSQFLATDLVTALAHLRRILTGHCGDTSTRS